MDTQIEKGFNSDVTKDGLSYHVQTEDWGKANPFVVSQVFLNGAVIKSVKNHYNDILPRGLNSNRSSVQIALRVQHQQILDLLLSGKLI